MPLSDYLIDIHSGDGNESLRPSYSAIMRKLVPCSGGPVPPPCSGVWSETIVQFAGSYSSLDDATPALNLSREEFLDRRGIW